MYPEWQTNIRKAQAEAAEQKRIKEEGERQRREEYQRKLQQEANEKFTFVLSKLLALPVSLSADGKYEIGEYAFVLLSVHEYTMRDRTAHYLDCSLRIERAGSMVAFDIRQVAKDGDWSAYRASLADHIDIADQLHAQAEEEKRKAKEFGELALKEFENRQAFFGTEI